MAISSICGWETGDPSEGFGSGGTCSVSTSVVRTGMYSLRCNPTTTGTGYGTVTGRTAAGISGEAIGVTSYTRFYFRYATKPSSGNEGIFYVGAGGRDGNRLVIRLNSDGTLSAYNNTTLISTGATVLSADTWYEIFAKCGNSSGEWEIKIGASVELSGTGQTFTPSSAGNGVTFGKFTNSNGNTVDFFYDDVSIGDAAYPPSGAVQIMQPDAGGNGQNWTVGAGSGSNYQQVDEIPSDSDTTYLLSPGTTTAETEALESGAWANISGTVNVVAPFAICKRNGASNGSVNLRLRSNTTDSDASDYGSTSSYVHLTIMLETDPATSAAWTLSALDSIEVGLLNASAANATRLTCCGAMVDYTTEATTLLFPVMQAPICARF